MEEISINGQRFEAGLMQLGRTLRKEYKYRVTTEDGVEHAELRACYLDFSLTLGNVNAAEYERLMDWLSACQDEVTLILPTRHRGEESYTGQFEGVSDELITQDEADNYWDSLTLDFTGTRPLEVSGG